MAHVALVPGAGRSWAPLDGIRGRSPPGSRCRCASGLQREHPDESLLYPSLCEHILSSLAGRREYLKEANPSLKLQSRSRVAVVGGGPAGSFFAFFLLQMASRAGLDLKVSIYEFKNYEAVGATGCNMCGGIVSESLVQLLAAEGINLPPTVVQRGIDSYRLHMDIGSTRIPAPGNEARIATVHRGTGPRGAATRRWNSFDGHLLALAKAKGAEVLRERVEGVRWDGGRPCVVTSSQITETYDLLVIATGVNNGARKLLAELGHGYSPPQTTKAAVSEFHLGSELVKKHFGNSAHMFLLNLPRLEFAALIPKGEYVTAVLLGDGIDKGLIDSFLATPQVRACFPAEWSMSADRCRCFPFMNVNGAAQPFADRLVLIGDCSESRLYKDGLGSAYRTAKAAAKTALFEGISGKDFRRHFLPVCRGLATDNSFGKLIFFVIDTLRRFRFIRRGILRMVEIEQESSSRNKRMTSVLWDVFTGSAPYQEIFLRTVHPLFTVRLLLATADSFFSRREEHGP
jgi:flavin-dependent dehydrogenase